MSLPTNCQLEEYERKLKIEMIFVTNVPSRTTGVKMDLEPDKYCSTTTPLAESPRKLLTNQHPKILPPRVDK